MKHSGLYQNANLSRRLYYAHFYSTQQHSQQPLLSPNSLSKCCFLPWFCELWHFLLLRWILIRRSAPANAQLCSFTVWTNFWLAVGLWWSDSHSWESNFECWHVSVKFFQMCCSSSHCYFVVANFTKNLWPHFLNFAYFNLCQNYLSTPNQANNCHFEHLSPLHFLAPSINQQVDCWKSLHFIWEQQIRST